MLHRLIFDQYKENPADSRTHLMNVLQSITSYNYMTINLRGGIANVTVGQANIIGEVWAKEYLGHKNWTKGGQYYAAGIPSYFAKMFSPDSISKADAIIKGLHIVDYDQRTGVVTTVDMEEWSKRLRDAGFMFLNFGEHYMQNRVMLSMMDSHHVVLNPRRDEPGQPKYAAMNEFEYEATAYNDAFYAVCDDNDLEKFNSWKESKKKQPNDIKDYVFFRKNLVMDFIKRLDNNKQDAFIKKLKDIKEAKSKEFNEAPTLYENLKLGDNGRMAFEDGSRLAEINHLKEGQEVTDAYRILGEFKNRVISVNKKIHGHYGKLDAASIETKWWGSLVMQYHKHIVPGIMKRYRAEGYFNEERGTVEKGSRIAAWDFLTMPIDDIVKKHNLSDGEKEALEGTQNILNYISDYFYFIKLNWNLLPDYERRNILRNLGDVFGILAGLIIALLLRIGFDDDDENWLYNFGLYQADRLTSELYAWSPYGAISEIRKLYSNPLAVQSIISDGLSAIKTIGGMILEGEDYNPYYISGRFAGRHKLGVYIERRIPYWRNFIALRDIADNNSYYKLGDTLMGILDIKHIAHKIKGIDD